MYALGLILGLLTGLALGVLGGGGSTLAVPVLVYVLGLNPKEAIAMSLPVVGMASLVGVAGHWRASHVDARVALPFGAVAMAGSFLGARLAGSLSGGTQLAIFAAVLLASSVSMLADRAPEPVRGAAPGRKLSPGLMVPVALAVGVLTGLVGVGGGFLIVPALVLLARIPIKQAIGTSLLVIAMNAAAGFAGYLGRVPLHWPLMLAFTALAVAGSLAGTRLVRYIQPRPLKRAFAVFLLAMGSFILYQNRAVLLPASALAPAAAQASSHT